MKKKRIIKILSFIITLICLSGVISFVMTPSSYIRVVLHDVRNASEDGAYDMIILGQSRGETNINPYVLDEYLDYNSYNLSRRILRMSDLYYLANENNNRSQVKVIILDVDHAYWNDPQINYYSDAYLLPNLHGVNKLDYFMRYTLSADYRVLLSRYSVHGSDDIKKIPERVSQKLSRGYRDYSMEAVTEKDSGNEYMGRGYHKGIAHRNGNLDAAWDITSIKPAIIEDVRRLADYCKDNDITLVAIHDPLPHGRLTETDQIEKRVYYNETFADMGVDYLDYNFIDDKYLQWEDEVDFSDAEGHMMGDFADRYSEVLGMILRKYLDGEDVSMYFCEEVNS